jgi:hypothetical protein
MKTKKASIKTIELLKHKIEYHYKNGQTISELEEEYVVNMINEGYSSGELCDVNSNGYWEIVSFENKYYTLYNKLEDIVEYLGKDWDNDSKIIEAKRILKENR